MPPPLNCWEIMNCGLEPGGRNTTIRGICPACLYKKLDGVNNGTNGGRACWVVPRTMCHDTTQGNFAEKALLCGRCEVYRQVSGREGIHFQKTVEILKKLKDKK
ncbi:MAG: hypothetical protein INQ03_06080 [Candidatus Heimdallarchaeota archaeon]|nr:hypothetical protein [Candidatus Heimdallarchaeota archaeon]